MQNSSSACLFLQGKPPHDQNAGHPEVLSVIPIQQFSQPQNPLSFILVRSFNILVNSISHYSLLFPTCTALSLSDPPLRCLCLSSRADRKRANCSVGPPCLQGPKERFPNPNALTFLPKACSICTWLELLILFSWFPLLAFFLSVILTIGNVSALVDLAFITKSKYEKQGCTRHKEHCVFTVRFEENRSTVC